MPDLGRFGEVHVDAIATTAGRRLFDSGSEGIEIVFELQGPLPESPEKTITGLLWLTEKALKRTTRTLAAVGVDLNDPSIETDADLFKAVEGKRFKLVCILEEPNEYHKSARWIVRYINGPKADTPTGSLLSRLRGNQGSLPLSGPVAAPGGPYDDDVPF